MKYKTIPGVIITSVCDKYFLVTPNETIRINETTAFYWKILEQGATVKDLYEKAVNNYEVEDPEVLRRDLRELVDSLLKKHLLVRCTS